MQMYKEKFGAARVEQMVPHMTQVFAELGIKYSLGGNTGNTFDSHRIAEWAKDKYGKKKQDDVMTAMFDRYFSKEQYLGDHKVLVSAVEEAGLPGAEAQAVLKDPQQYKQTVETELGTARKYQVSGVPFFVIHPPEEKGGARPYGLSGAQESSTFVQIFEEFGLKSG